MARAPVLFIGHGSPMNAITENPYTQAWSALARRFAKPSAILCISAHWETDGVFVTASARPRTIHDFYGFPPELYRIAYEAPGAPELAQRLAAMIDAKGDGESWGLDHGAWSVLRALYPDADVPVVQLSLDRGASAADHYAVGRRLVSLRDDNVLILGSGNIVHNLRYFRGATRPFDWAIRFNDAATAKIAARDHEALIAYEALTPDARLAVPTAEHYLPLLYALAAQGGDEMAEIFTDDVLTSLSMSSVAIGLA
jgi:4,5-DOPA dioxygenase extradiol